MRRCCFADAVGRRVAGCTKARKSAERYRRTVHCLDGDAHGRCAAWLDRVRHGSRFAFGTPHTPGALSRPSADRLQRGGLLGMGDLLDGQTVSRVDDVSQLLRRAEARFNTLEQVPLQSVIQRLHEHKAGNG